MSGVTGSLAQAQTPLERSRLAELEAIIERGLATFIEVGTALAEVRDSRLYRETHATFADYCRERWNFSRSHGYRLIRAAQFAAVSPTDDIRNERQARALLEPAKADPGRRIIALAFGVDPDAPLPASVEAVWKHAGERPPTLDEAIDAAATREEKIAVALYYAEHLPEFKWATAGEYLLEKAVRETTGASLETVEAICETAAGWFYERVIELEQAAAP